MINFLLGFLSLSMMIISVNPILRDLWPTQLLVATWRILVEGTFLCYCVCQLSKRDLVSYRLSSEHNLFHHHDHPALTLPQELEFAVVPMRVPIPMEKVRTWKSEGKRDLSR